MVSEHHLRVQRTARYYLLGEPREAVREIWVVCHGYGQLASRFLHAFEPLDDGSRIVVAPEALSRFYLTEGAGARPDARVGASWMTKEDRLAEIEDQGRYLDAVHAEVCDRIPGPRPLHVLGFSQGVATAARWLARGRVRARSLVLWAGTLPPELSLDAGSVLRELDLTLVAGTGDQFATPDLVRRQEEALEEAGVPFELRRFEGGHRLDDDVLADVVRRASPGADPEASRRASRESG